MHLSKLLFINFIFVSLAMGLCNNEVYHFDQGYRFHIVITAQNQADSSDVINLNRIADISFNRTNHYECRKSAGGYPYVRLKAVPQFEITSSGQTAKGAFTYGSGVTMSPTLLISMIVAWHPPCRIYGCF